jgi:hypothetical protein
MSAKEVTHSFFVEALNDALDNLRWLADLQTPKPPVPFDPFEL